MTNSEIGKRFLAENYDTHRLEIFYDNDSAPHINLCENRKAKNGEIISFEKALDMTAIYEQIGQFKAS
ncbi:MAG: hypothetical protein IJ859_01450 [Synergistaceae bacterium]|nr:hypothetical protein [Synergistaceae bacterium]MBR2207453.1 hypothetical protein [Synergistaceae bacterium]